jgi:hypothetical protein
MMGLCMGEIFYRKEFADDCVNGDVCEFFFCGQPLIILAAPARRSSRR